MMGGLRFSLARLLRRWAARLDPATRGPAVLAIDTPDEVQITTIFNGAIECHAPHKSTISQTRSLT